VFIVIVCLLRNCVRWVSVSMEMLCLSKKCVDGDSVFMENVCDLRK
jgi:hypothetical protein